MRLIDRISLGRTIQMFLDFLYKIAKLYSPKNKEENSEPNNPKKPRKPLFPKIRKKIDEITH